MAYTVNIGGVDKTSLVLAKTLNIRLGANHRDSASFVIKTKAGTFMPRAGQPVTIEDAGTVFAGLIESAPQTKVAALDGDSTDIYISVTTAGLNVIPYRRVGSGTYTAEDAGNIVSDMITSYLSAEGITAGTITAGANLDYDATDKTIGTILDELASASGYQWYIDTAKALHFVQDISISAAAHDLVEGGAFTDYRQVSVTEQTDQYRNRQIIRGGIKSDGTTLSYTTEDAAEIVARAAIEGGSGIYENVYYDGNIVSDTVAAAVATNLLKKYGLIPLAISFESYSTDWRPATKLKVNMPSFGISSDRYFLIESVTMQDISDNRLRVSVSGVSKDTSDFSTQPSDDYVDYFKRWLENQNKLIKDSQNYADHIGSGKNTVYFQDTQPTGGAYVAGDTWFDTDDDNRIYKWSGAAWVAVLFGENAIADLSITNAKIANLDAAKITSGYIAAARIDVDTLYIKKLWANSSVLNYLTYEPSYTWSGQTFAGTQYWTDDADASPSAVQHLLLLGDVSKADAESQTIITAVSLDDEGADLNYETNLKIGSMVPTQLGDGNYGYAEFIGNTSGGNGSVILGAGNSDGSDFFNVTVEYNQFLVGNESDSDILKVTQYGLDLAGRGIFTSYLKSDRDTGVDIDSIEAVNSSANAWNDSANYDLLLENSNNAMSFILSGTANERKGMIQVGHNNTSFAGTIGELWLNPLGGAVKTTDLTITGSGTIGGATLANGWLKLGTGLAFDDNEMYFSGDCYIGSIGGTVNFRRGTTTIFSFDGDSIDMAKQLNMGSNDITLSGDITGSTSDTWIQARRIGLGVAPNTTYTMDAGTTGYIRAGKYYAGSSGGVSNSYKLQDFNVGGYYTLTFTGGILTGSSWSST